MSLAMLLSCLGTIVAAEEVKYDDIDGHWASAYIMRWSNAGILLGYAGKYRPDDSITRGEMATILDRIMRYQTKASNTFTDLGQDFYTDPILKVNATGIMVGFNNKIRPLDTITREEAATVLVRVLGLNLSNNQTKFADNGKMDWSIPYVAALTELGYMDPHAGNNFDPQTPITRAEFVTSLSKAIDLLIQTSKTEKGGTYNNVVVSASGVTLDGVTIKGDLIIAEGVADGEVTLNNTKVAGKLIVRGGGKNSIIMKGTTSAGSVIVEKSSVAVKVQGSATVGTVTIAQNASNVAVTTSSGTTVNSVISQGPNSTISGTGSVSSISLGGSNGSVSVKGAQVNVGSGAFGASVDGSPASAGTSVTSAGTTSSAGTPWYAGTPTPTVTPTRTPTPTATPTATPYNFSYQDWYNFYYGSNYNGNYNWVWDFSTYTVKSVGVSPASSTVYMSGSIQYTAAVYGTGVPPQGVTWSATGGSISSSGLWTAPATAGTYTITATSTANSSYKGTATVTVTGTVQPTDSLWYGAVTGTAGNAVVAVTPSCTLAGTKTYTATNLPEGLSINSTTGVISGTVYKEGTYTATVTANNGSKSVSASVSIIISLPPFIGERVMEIIPVDAANNKIITVVLSGKGSALVGDFTVKVTSGETTKTLSKDTNASPVADKYYIVQDGDPSRYKITLGTALKTGEKLSVAGQYPLSTTPVVLTYTEAIVVKSVAVTSKTELTVTLDAVHGTKLTNADISKFVVLFTPKDRNDNKITRYTPTALTHDPNSAIVKLTISPLNGLEGNITVNAVGTTAPNSLTHNVDYTIPKASVKTTTFELAKVTASPFGTLEIEINKAIQNKAEVGNEWADGLKVNDTHSGTVTIPSNLKLPDGQSVTYTKFDGTKSIITVPFTTTATKAPVTATITIPAGKIYDTKGNALPATSFTITIVEKAAPTGMAAVAQPTVSGETKGQLKLTYSAYSSGDATKDAKDEEAYRKAITSIELRKADGSLFQTINASDIDKTKVTELVISRSKLKADYDSTVLPDTKLTATVKATGYTDAITAAFDLDTKAPALTAPDPVIFEGTSIGGMLQPASKVTIVFDENYSAGNIDGVAAEIKKQLGNEKVNAAAESDGKTITVTVNANQEVALGTTVNLAAGTVTDKFGNSNTSAISITLNPRLTTPSTPNLAQNVVVESGASAKFVFTNEIPTGVGVVAVKEETKRDVTSGEELKATDAAATKEATKTLSLPLSSAETEKYYLYSLIEVKYGSSAPLKTLTMYSLPSTTTITVRAAPASPTTAYVQAGTFANNHKNPMHYINNASKGNVQVVVELTKPETSMVYVQLTDGVNVVKGQVANTTATQVIIPVDASALNDGTIYIEAWVVVGTSGGELGSLHFDSKTASPSNTNAIKDTVLPTAKLEFWDYQGSAQLPSAVYNNQVGVMIIFDTTEVLSVDPKITISGVDNKQAEVTNKKDAYRYYYVWTIPANLTAANYSFNASNFTISDGCDLAGNPVVTTLTYPTGYTFKINPTP